MRGSFAIGGQTMCRSCTEQFVASRSGGTVPAGSITRLVDATVCAKCEADNGSLEFGRVAGAPLCDTCTAFFRNRPFPTWLKWSFVGFVCVALAAQAYNWRYFMAYVELLRGNRALAKGNVDEATDLLDSAAKRVPDIPELAVTPNVLRAMQLINQEKDEEALALLESAKLRAPPQLATTIREGEIQANIGIAFRRKDYDAFLSLAQEMEKLEPNSLTAVCDVASAYACKYAVSGNAAFRDQSLQYLNMAKGLAGPREKDFAEYENRIQHRLATRKVITGKEFKEQFPNGWKAN
jgi:tetratricopeptide (TPR) repeat protein